MTIGDDKFSQHSVLWLCPIILFDPQHTLTLQPHPSSNTPQGVRFGTTQLFRWSNPNITAETGGFFPALLDSGSSCLVIPDSKQVWRVCMRFTCVTPQLIVRTTQDGTFSISPYQLWLSIIKDTENPASKDSFFVDLDGTEYEIPYDVWYAPPPSPPLKYCNIPPGTSKRFNSRASSRHPRAFPA
jgi:hypothetical protein